MKYNGDDVWIVVANGRRKLNGRRRLSNARIHEDVGYASLAGALHIWNLMGYDETILLSLWHQVHRWQMPEVNVKRINDVQAADVRQMLLNVGPLVYRVVCFMPEY